MKPKLLLLLAVAALLVLFIAQNYQVVGLRFLFWKLEMSQAVLIFVALAAGVGLGWLSRGARP